MKKKPLKETNPYLKDSKKYESSLIKNVITSSAVEGIRITPALLKSAWAVCPQETAVESIRITHALPLKRKLKSKRT